MSTRVSPRCLPGSTLVHLTLTTEQTPNPRWIWHGYWMTRVIICPEPGLLSKMRSMAHRGFDLDFCLSLSSSILPLSSQKPRIFKPLLNTTFLRPETMSPGLVASAARHSTTSERCEWVLLFSFFLSLIWTLNTILNHLICSVVEPRRREEGGVSITSASRMGGTGGKAHFVRL